MSVEPNHSELTRTTAQPDTINELAGIAAGSPLAELRVQRPDVLSYTQGSDDALFSPSDPGGVSLIERELIALRVAALTHNRAVASRHVARLKTLGADLALASIAEGGDSDAVPSPRLSALLQFTDRLTLDPRTARPDDIEALRTAGLSPRDIVTIAQLIAYLSYQVRLLSGLRILGDTQ